MRYNGSPYVGKGYTQRTNIHIQMIWELICNEAISKVQGEIAPESQLIKYKVRKDSTLVARLKKPAVREILQTGLRPSVF